MALSDCIECWQTPCECGHEFKNTSLDYKEVMTKSINGFTIKDVFLWLEKNNYLLDDSQTLYRKFIKSEK